MKVSHTMNNEPGALAKTLAVLFLLAVVGSITYFCGMNKPGPYYYGHCNSCGQTYKVSGWTLPGQNVNSICPKCGRGTVYFETAIGSEAWQEEKERWGE